MQRFKQFDRMNERHINCRSNKVNAYKSNQEQFFSFLKIQNESPQKRLSFFRFWHSNTIETDLVSQFYQNQYLLGILLIDFPALLKSCRIEIGRIPSDSELSVDFEYEIYTVLRHRYLNLIIILQPCYVAPHFRKEESSGILVY